MNNGLVHIPEQAATNGILHKIDRVLSPPGVGETIWGLIRDPYNQYPEYQLTYVLLFKLWGTSKITF